MGERRYSGKWTVLVVLAVWMLPALIVARSEGQQLSSIAPEKFVPSFGRATGGGTLELRAEATVYGADVHLKQVVRWPDAAESFFAPIGDLVVMRLGEGSAFRSLSLVELKSRLRDAGVNLAVIRFAGATACTVGRGDVTYDEAAALRQWVDARAQANGPSDQLSSSSAPPDRRALSGEAANKERQDHPAADGQARAGNALPASRSLRGMLTNDLAVRLGVQASALQVDFSPRDQKVLELDESVFGFQITPRRVNGLGRVEWDVALVRGDDSRSVTISATARLWQHEVVVARPLAYRQVIQDQDLAERDSLVEQMPPVAVLKREQVVNQQAAMELKPGTVVTARMVDPVPLVRQGQLVTVTIASGGVTITTVGRALEQGAFGQTVRVRNDATREVYEILVTGPQTGRMGRGTQIASTD